MLVEDYLARESGRRRTRSRPALHPPPAARSSPRVVELTVTTERQSQLVDITQLVRDALAGQQRLGRARLRAAHDGGRDDQRARRPGGRARLRDGARADRPVRLAVAAHRGGGGERADAHPGRVHGAERADPACGTTARSRSARGRASSSASSTGRASGPCSSAFSPDARLRRVDVASLEEGDSGRRPRRSRSRRGWRGARARCPGGADRRRRSGRTATPSGAGSSPLTSAASALTRYAATASAAVSPIASALLPVAAPRRNAIAPNVSPSAPAVSDAASRFEAETPMSKTAPRPTARARARSSRAAISAAVESELRRRRRRVVSRAGRAADRAFRALPRRRSRRSARDRGDHEEERHHEREQLDPEVAGARDVVDRAAERDERLQRLRVLLDEPVQLGVVPDARIDARSSSRPCPTSPIDHQSEARGAGRGGSSRRRYASMRPPPVEREEDVLEVGLVAVEADDLEPRERLHEPVGGPLEGERDDGAVPPGLAYAGDARRTRPRRRHRRERDDDAAERSCAAATRRPRRARAARPG